MKKGFTWLATLMLVLASSLSAGGDGHTLLLSTNSPAGGQRAQKAGLKVE
jgi:hypothetical protein